MDREKFYRQCLQDLHEEAAMHGSARGGMVYAPDLLPFGERAVTAYYGNPLLAAELAADPLRYYYTLNRFCLQCGILFASLYESDPLALTDGYVSMVTAMDPQQLAERHIRERLHLAPEAFDLLCRSVFDRWVGLVAPHEDGEEASDCIYYASLAVYQLGISMVAGAAGRR